MTTSDDGHGGRGGKPWWRWLFAAFRRAPKQPGLLWEHGTSDVGGTCRRHRITGHIEFILWPAGHERGYPDRPFWCEMGAGHTFIPEQKQEKP
jgi:hypothetical protein